MLSYYNHFPLTIACNYDSAHVLDKSEKCISIVFFYRIVFNQYK